MRASTACDSRGDRHRPGRGTSGWSASSNLQSSLAIERFRVEDMVRTIVTPSAEMRSTQGAVPSTVTRAQGAAAGFTLVSAKDARNAVGVFEIDGVLQ